MVRHHLLPCIALLFWLVAGWGGMHEHVSYDGHDAALSVHMEIESDHAAHHADGQHADMDVDQLQSALSSFVKLDMPVLLIVALMLVFQDGKQQAPRLYLHLKPPRRSTVLLPPLRAPPSIPA